jgi:hypothetical protein
MNVQVFEKNVLRMIFGPRRYEASGKFRVGSWAWGLQPYPVKKKIVEKPQKKKKKEEAKA